MGPPWTGGVSERALGVTVLLCLLTTNGAAIAADDPKDAVVLLDSDGKSGAGILLALGGPRLYVATAAHVIEKLDGPIKVDLRRPGQRLVGTILQRWPELDLALLAVVPGPGFVLPELTAADPRALRRGKALDVVGQCFGRWHPIRGSLGGIDAGQLTVESLPRNLDACSGGAVLTEDGHLAGMALQGDGARIDVLLVTEIVRAVCGSYSTAVSSRLIRCRDTAGSLRGFFDAQYGHASLGVDLPRDLRIHANHPDDPFLPGDPGETPLDRVAVDNLQLEVGLRYALALRPVAFFLGYVAAIPFSQDGRSERQQANDPRPPSSGPCRTARGSDRRRGGGRPMARGGGRRPPHWTLGPRVREGLEPLRK